MSPDRRQSAPSALIGEDEILVMVEEAIAAARAPSGAPTPANDCDDDMTLDGVPGAGH